MVTGGEIRGYAALPSWMIRDESISGPALLVYAALASRAGFESIHPGQQVLAAEARCSERRVRDALKELTELGVIDRVERRFKSGARASDAYVLRSGRQPAATAASDDQPAENDTTNRQNRTSIPSIEITTTEIANNVRESALAASGEGFETWWATYPRKAGKKAAVKAYAAAVESIKAPDPEVILLQGLERARQSWVAAGTEPRFIPHPATWLNQGRWEDEPIDVGARALTAAERMMQGLDTGKGRNELGA